MTTPTKTYLTCCATHQIETNPHITDVLVGVCLYRNYVLKLAGNNRLKPVQRLVDKDAFALSECLLLCQGLTDLSYNNITDEGVISLISLIQVRGTLRSLDLTFNNIGADGAELLSQSLQGNSTLLSLTLSGNKVGRLGGMSLANLLQFNNTLQALYLARCDLDAQSVIAFAIALKTNQTLRCLDISRSVMSQQQEEWAVHFSHMLALNKSLQELHLGLKEIMSTGMERLSKGLLFNHSLTYLDLRCNRVMRDDVQPLVDVLVKESSSLEVLDLSFNQLRDEGAVLLSEALASPNCSLKELSLCGNNIHSEGLLALAEALSVNSEMTHMYIWGNHFDGPVCVAFRDLIQSGRLHPDHTDVRAYEVNAHVFLACVCHNLRKTFYEPENNSSHEISSSGASPVGMRFYV
uniref:Leucine rich repeat containing 34 n=1 Tax=Neogobius melanostomus TaxID=47308 RepID=A0A8C6TBU6_9GOBI